METSLENIQPVVLLEVEAVQEFLVQEAGELLDRLNGSLSGKVVETVLSFARTMMLVKSLITSSWGWVARLILSTVILAL